MIIVAPAGQRFTAVHANPYFRNQFGQTVIEAVTCPDRFMPLLGRGKPALSTREGSSIVYVSHDNGRTFRAVSSRRDLGYLNAQSLRCNPHVWVYGTTHGLLHSLSQGAESCLFSASLPLESLRPFTAVGGSITGSQLYARKFVQALDPSVPGRLSRCDLGGDLWSWTTCKGDMPKGLIAIVAADQTASSTGNNWWILAADGLYRSNDSGATLHKVLQP